MQGRRPLDAQAIAAHRLILERKMPDCGVHRARGRAMVRALHSRAAMGVAAGALACAVFNSDGIRGLCSYAC